MLFNRLCLNDVDPPDDSVQIANLAVSASILCAINFATLLVFIRARHVHRKWVKAGGKSWNMQGHMISLFIAALALSLPAAVAWCVTRLMPLHACAAAAPKPPRRFMQMYLWIKAIRESAFCAKHYSLMVDYHTALIVGMAVLRPLCFALFLVAKCLVLLRLVEITAPGSNRTMCLRIACIVSVVASNLVTLVAAALFGSTDGYYLNAYENAQSVIKSLDQQRCIDSLGHFNASSASCRSTLFSDVLPVLDELKARQRDSVEYATLHYGSQARCCACDGRDCGCK
jgi:hypothetical protein